MNGSSMGSIGTIGGGIAGGIFGGPAGAAIGSSVGGALGNSLSSSGQQAGNLTGQYAQAQLAQQQQDRQQASSAANSPAELAQLQSSVSTNNDDIQRKSQILQSTDPAIMEAGRNALSLLQGGSSPLLAPLNNQIANQQQNLNSSLQSKLGTGYGTSTAGMQAQSLFNQSANAATTSAQQSTLSGLLGTISPFSQSGLATNSQIGSQQAGQFGNIAQRQVSALNANPITMAGAQYTGQMATLNNQTAQNNVTMNGLGKAFGQYQGGSLGSLFGGSASGGSSALGNISGGGTGYSGGSYQDYGNQS